MTRQILMLYLIYGKPVGVISDELRISRATVRRHLKEGGIILRPTKGTYLRGRGPVCDAVSRRGFESFHEFSQIKGLDTITSQANYLSVPEKALSRVYGAYQRFLRSLKSAGIVLPTSQFSGADVERHPTRDAAS